ncbi:hypothetical protein PG987_010536 [Apiospora arundinis]
MAHGSVGSRRVPPREHAGPGHRAATPEPRIADGDASDVTRAVLPLVGAGGVGAALAAIADARHWGGWAQARGGHARGRLRYFVGESGRGEDVEEDGQARGSHQRHDLRAQGHLHLHDLGNGPLLEAERHRLAAFGQGRRVVARLVFGRQLREPPRARPGARRGGIHAWLQEPGPSLRLGIGGGGGRFSAEEQRVARRELGQNIVEERLDVRAEGNLHHAGRVVGHLEALRDRRFLHLAIGRNVDGSRAEVRRGRNPLLSPPRQ